MQIAARDGLQSMPLNNPARHAGVSNSGVMHQFPTEARLIEAVVTQSGERHGPTVLPVVARDPQPRLRWASAFEDCTFAPPVSHRPPSRSRGGLKSDTQFAGLLDRRDPHARRLGQELRRPLATSPQPGCESGREQLVCRSSSRSPVTKPQRRLPR